MTSPDKTDDRDERGFLANGPRPITLTCRGQTITRCFLPNFVDTRLWCAEQMFQAARNTPELERAFAGLALSVLTDHFNGKGSVHACVKFQDCVAGERALQGLVYLPVFLKSDGLEITRASDAQCKISLDMELPPVSYVVDSEPDEKYVGWNWIFMTNFYSSKEREDMFARLRDWVERVNSY